MPVDGVSNTTGSSTYVPPAAERVPKKTLGQEDFFQLLAVQLSSQDPLKPMEDTDFIAQMASFSSLESMNQLTDSFARMISLNDFSAAQSLLGRQVTVASSDGTEVTGIVSSLHNDGEGTLITVNGADYSVSSVRRVEIPDSTTATN